MDLRHLRSFLTVAERLHFGRAAIELELSQSAVSQHVAQLEEELRTPLFIRENPKAIQLTQAGEVLKEHAARILANVRDAREAIRGKLGMRRGVLRVAHSPMHREPTVAATAEMLRGPQDVRIEIEEMFSARIEARVRDGSLDLGLVNAQGRTSGVEHEELAAAPLRLVVHENHPLARDKRTRIERLEELRNERFVLTRKGLRSRRTLDMYFELKRFIPTIVAEASAMATVLAIVRSQPKVVTILPVPAPHLTELRDLPLLNLPDALQLQQSTYLLWRGSGGGAPHTEEARAFRDALRRHMSGAPKTRRA